MTQKSLPSNGLLAAGLFVLSAAVLCLELLGMRLLSFMLWHHLAYMVLSVAMLGFGASGAWLASSVEERDPRSVIVWSAILFSVSNLLGFMVLSHIQLDTFEMSPFKLLKLGVYYAVLIVPYFFAGLAVAAIFRAASEKTTTLYFVNLLGSGIGCYLFMVIIAPLGGPGALTAMSALGMVAALLWSIGYRRPLTAASAAGVAVFAVLVPFANALLPLQPAASKSLAKHLSLPGAEIQFTEWTPLARIDVVKAPAAFNPFLGQWRTGDIMRTITIDGDANTWMFNHPHIKEVIESKEHQQRGLLDVAPGDLSARQTDEVLRMNEYALAFLTKPKGGEALIIGAGGGNEVATALVAGVKHVTAVELNPAILSQSTDHLKEFFGLIYESGRATPVLSEGRSFVRRSDKKFDVIQMSGVDTWSGLSSGAYVLSENYLYTVDAVKDFYGHLNTGGVLSIGRFALKPPRETLRLLSNALRALEELGVAKPYRHVMVITYGPKDTARLLVKRAEFTPDEVAYYKDLVAEGKALESRIWYAPYITSELSGNPYIGLVGAVVENGGRKEQRFYDEYPYDVTPVYDDRPFFFEYYKWRSLFRDMAGSGSGGQVGAAKPIGLTILFFLLLQVLVLCLIFIFVPLKRLGKRGQHLPHRLRVISGFGSLGLAFMFVEVGLMQKLVLFLGHPSYSISVSLFAILVGSGLGSLAAGRLPWSPQRIVIASTAAIAAIACLYLAVLDRITGAFLGAPLLEREIIAGIAVAVLAFPMGMPFPISLKKAGELGPAVVPWAFGINGGASVLGSILCIFVAMSLGFQAVLAIAAALYLLAMPCLVSLIRAGAAKPE